MFKNKIKIIGLLVCFGVLTVAGFVFAQSDLGLNDFGNQTVLGTKPIGQTIAEIVRIFLSVLGIIAVVLILYAGFLWMTAAGNAEKIGTAKKLMINAIIGLGIILSSLAITQFVIGALQNATGSKVLGTEEGGGGGGGGFGSDSFALSGISPQGNISIRNVVARMSFNHFVQSATVSGNVLITKKSDNSIISGNFSTAGNTIEFVPSAACPAPNQSLKCFEANTTYRIEVRTGLKDAGGKNLICGGFAMQCTAEFTTGSLVDVAPPQISITYPDPGQSVPQNGLVNVWANAVDDSAVSHIEFFADGAYFDNDFPQTSSPSFEGRVLWDTSGISRGGHNLTARAYDIDSNNSFSPALNVIVRAEHCFNAVKDTDETGVDCGGADCAVCAGGSCQTNGDCGSGSCQNGVCVDTPIILGISPLDGAPGTYVTVSGNYFGPTAGTVTFLGGAGSGDDKVAQLAPCAGGWSASQVIVLVPQGAVSGPIEIKTSVGTDATNDARGPVLSNFIINNKNRPGICSLNPAEGKSGTDFNISGINFGGSQGAGLIKFGNVFAVPKNWTASLIVAIVPVLESGANSISVVQDGTESNAVNFNLLSQTAGTKPLINYVNPDKGPVGEYITLFGNNFGDKLGVVEFLRQDGTKAVGDANFPAACGTIDYWHNTSITIKVPDKFSDGASTKNTAISLRIRRSDNELSNTVPFNINSNTPSPGICGIKPNNGPIGTSVDILGERLGTSGSISFYNNVNATPGAWGSEVVKTAVPANTVSGPVKVTVGGVASNSVNFSVGDCGKTPGLCGVDQQCCNSSCILKTDTCKSAPKEGAYAWRISTGAIPKVPHVIEDCSVGEDAKTPSPSPWDSRPGGNSVCLNAIVNLRFDSKLDPNTVVMNGVAADTIVLYKCTETAPSKDPCSARTKVSVDGINSGIYSAGTNEDGVEIYPVGGLERNTKYLVELTTGVRGLGVGGGYMEEKSDCGKNISYCFEFKTADSTGFCKVGSVAISPQTMVSEKQELLDYLAQPRAKEDVCLSLNAQNYSYSWSSGDATRAMINRLGFDTKGNAKNNAAIIQTLRETLLNTPVTISSSIPSENVTGKGNLTIDFSDPIVVSKWPSCDTACVNSVIGAQFNVDMNPATIIPANISVFRCKTENCDSYDGAVSGSIVYSSVLKQFNFTPASSLEINKFYQVRLDALSIRSSSGVALTGANAGRYFIWQFKTRNNATPCTVNKVNVIPESATLNYIGQRLSLDSEALGVPDSCNPQGQKLNNYLYNWTWTSTKPTVAAFLLSGAYNVLPFANKGCNEMCLHMGTKPGVSVCGNGKLEKGESCDDSNVKSGDGCSPICLKEGAVAPTCGNNVKNTNEDCDDGNIVSGDGCSDRCLAEGATAGKSICGNNFIGKGETCDDENNISGDGCSSQCLNEGTEAGVGSCGNNIVETAKGEDCDDGNIVSNDGCSSVCLNEGSIYGGGICGNGKLEKGEDCDDSNILPGDGCSSQCLSEGSSLSYSSPSFCGNNTKEKGEDLGCDASLPSDTNVDPRQYIEARGAGDTVAQAVASSIIGKSNVKVLCVYKTDAQCAPFAKPGEVLGAGADNCCYLKPKVIGVVPKENSSGVCRNTLISLTYSQLVDQNAGTLSIDEARSGSCPSGSTPSSDGLWCQSAVKASRSASENQSLGQTKFDFNILSILKSNTRYRVTANDFKNKQGVLGINYSWIFTTGGDICKFEKINFLQNSTVIDSVIFNKVEGQNVTAQAVSFNNNQEQPIAPVAGIYEWSWSWSQVDLADSITLANTTGATVLATSKQKNGEGYFNAIATITKDAYNLSPEKTIFDQIPVTVFLCENPWPTNSLGQMTYFSDPDATKGISVPGNNFRTYYCRDTKAVCKDKKCSISGKTCNTDSDCLLPYLNSVNVTANIGSISDITRELLFTDSSSGDAIGIRVYKNLNHLSPLAWYKAKEFQGQPQSAKVDGYEAVADGRSTYINAANHTDTGSNYTNIFVVSFSQNATAEMQSVYKQVAENLRFNTNLTNFKQCQLTGKSCSNNLDCSSGDTCRADKEKITRDTKRLADLGDAANILEEYKSINNSYPQILSGSFLRGWSVSTWPSWQAALGNDLGKALPSDPINKFAGCKTPFDSATCWNGAAGQYQCPTGSRVYQYRNINQDSYQLGSDFEYSNATGWSNINTNFAISGVCAGGILGTSASCGDGVVGGAEQCEKGNIKIDSCTINGRSGFRRLTCGTNCMWDTSPTCISGQCGDGVVQAGEACDDGQNNGKYGYCSTTCGALSSFCGDSVVTGSEQCDKGSLNGNYGSGCSWECKLPGPSCGDKIINGAEQCDSNSETTKDAVGSLLACGISNGYQTYRTRVCGSSCAWGAWGNCQAAGSCGNGTKDGTEECDTASGTTGDCVMDLVKNYACRNASCGDGYLRTGKEVCDSGAGNGVECQAGYGLTCNYCSNLCTVITKTGPYCADKVKNGPEECDEKDFGGLSCRSFGFLEFSSGTFANQTPLACNGACSVNTANCKSIIRVNAGGQAFVDKEGRSWVADVYYTNGGAWPGEPSLSDTDWERVYKTERNAGDELKYSFPIGPGAFKVRLHFEERYLVNNKVCKLTKQSCDTSACAPGDVCEEKDIGSRVFNVFLGETQALTNFDIIKEAGGVKKPIVKEFLVNVTSQNLDLILRKISTSVHGPKISAIEIESSASGGQYSGGTFTAGVVAPPASIPNPVCGNGKVETGEECDDANYSRTDSCISCRNAYCGDGEIWSGREYCDDNGSNGMKGYCDSYCSYKLYLSSISPNQGQGGTTVTLNGIGFGSQSPNGSCTSAVDFYSFYKADATIISWSDTQIVAKVPLLSPDRYSVVVERCDKGIDSNIQYFSIN
ncbi:MAG: DUF4215 domain-containing protein [Patescibacteria group bacterium]